MKCEGCGCVLQADNASYISGHGTLCETCARGFSEVATETPKANSLTDTELRQLALDIVEGKVFGSWNLDNHNRDMLTCIFMPIALGARAENAAHAYEYLDKRAGVSVNGYPTFFSVRFLAKEDVQPLFAHIQQLHTARDAFLKG